MQTTQPVVTNSWRSINALADRLNEGAKYPTFTTHSLRHYVRNAGRNGLDRAVKRLGSKILIHEAGFLAWLDGREDTGAKE